MLLEFLSCLPTLVMVMEEGRNEPSPLNDEKKTREYWRFSVVREMNTQSERPKVDSFQKSQANLPIKL